MTSSSILISSWRAEIFTTFRLFRAMLYLPLRTPQSSSGIDTLTATKSCCIGLWYTSPKFSATWLKPILAFTLALKRDSFFVLSTFRSASSTFCFSSSNCGLLLLPHLKASSTGISIILGREGSSSSIWVFLSRFRKDASENIARFKALALFCNVFCAFTLSSFKVNRSACEIAAIRCRCCPMRYKVSVDARFSFASLYSACAIASEKK